MQKLKNKVIDRMMTMHLTKAEVDFILELAHYQDEKGRIRGVYYKKMCQATGFSHETFYVTLESLADKGLIYVEKAAYGDFDITILDNDFTYKEAIKEGYVSVGKFEMFYDDNFKELKAGEKLLALQLLKIIGANQKYVISVENFIAKYVQLLQVTRRTIRGYIFKLSRFFNVTRKSNIFTFWVRKADSDCTINMPTDLDNLSQHLTDVACRRNKVPFVRAQYIETKHLIKQYHFKLKADISNVFLQAVKSSLEKINAAIPNKYKWTRELRPALIHKLMIQKM